MLYRGGNMVWLAATLAWLGAIGAFGEPVVVSRRHQEYHDQQERDLDSMEVSYDRSALTEPCSVVECPEIQHEIPVAAIGGALRKYVPKDWVYVASDTWKFKHPTAIDFKEALEKIIEYQKGGNYMGRTIPVTAPLLVEITTTQEQPGGAQPIEFEKGIKLYTYMPAQYQDDPYAEPTNLKMHMTEFTPHDGHDWVAVHQWKNPPPVAPIKVDGEWVNAPKVIDEKKDILKHATWFSKRLGQAMKSAGAPSKVIDKMYFAAYGHEFNRVNELWIPVHGDHLANL